ncbi:uncharacterized protein LOC117714038 isoform X2 [Arvicanthis niloticus]|uniref:uncharacterized protein LOC117714038 isoform X2 n=1 Tax=Arvicanthis niloticus TaxID=61156 RepID=UPI00402B5698
MKKLFGNWNRRHSSSASSTSQKESFLGPDGQCWDAIALHSFKKLKSYKAFGKIHKAASRGAVATVQSRLILEKNGVNDRDKNDRTMLHYACAHGHPVVVALLIKWNCDIDLRDSDNCTALIKTSQYGNGECASILLDHGADPNTKDNHGNTALHYAVWYNNTSMANILLEHHADISIRNKDTFTPCTLARLRNNESLAKFLVDKRDQILRVDELNRLKRKRRKKKVRIKFPTEDSGQLQVILDGTRLFQCIWFYVEILDPLGLEACRRDKNGSICILLHADLQVTEEADKQKVIRLQSAENMNDSWVYSSENGNHSAIHVSENLNSSSVYTLEKETQTEEPAAETVMNSVVQEAEKLNHNAAALVLQKQDGKTEEQPVPVEENQEDDGLKHINPEIKVEPNSPTEGSRGLQVILDHTSLVTEEADKKKVIRLQSAENLNDSWVHASEDQIQSVVHASENGNHSAIHVSENLNPSSAYKSENENQTEVPAAETMINSVLQEAENPNHIAAALVVQKHDGETEEQPVPVEENLEDDGLNIENLMIKVELEHPTEDSEQLQVILDRTSLVTEEADKKKVIRLQSAENLNDSWVHASDQIQSVVHASENGNHSAIHVSESLNPSSAYTSENEIQTEVPTAETMINSVLQEAENPNHIAAALDLQKQDGETEEQPVPVEENLEDDGLDIENLMIKVELEHPTEDSEQLQVILDCTSLV